MGKRVGLDGLGEKEGCLVKWVGLGKVFLFLFLEVACFFLRGFLCLI